KDQKDGAGVAPGFRFNPALMAPVPVAKQKEATGSERLRKVANELAQKIVERVRVGTNAAGKVEFQVDLRSDVLAGLSVKVSANNGKISAVFQGSDKDVLKMIEEHEDALKEALKARGLSLEDFKIEART
ncbi:MAG: flagellar hook-length control protein FliK, partial [Myxococcota bacterium]